MAVSEESTKIGSPPLSVPAVPVFLKASEDFQSPSAPSLSSPLTTAEGLVPADAGARFQTAEPNATELSEEEYAVNPTVNMICC
jgi:hypothetical protein